VTSEHSLSIAVYIHQKEPLNSFVAVEQAKKAMAAKKLDEMERHTTNMTLESIQKKTGWCEALRTLAAGTVERDPGLGRLLLFLYFLSLP